MEGIEKKKAIADRAAQAGDDFYGFLDLEGGDGRDNPGQIAELDFDPFFRSGLRISIEGPETDIFGVDGGNLAGESGNGSVNQGNPHFFADFFQAEAGGHVVQGVDGDQASFN